jgi:two-component system sensor histidine kinase DegS
MIMVDREQETSYWEALIENIRGELDRSSQELREINLMLEQSQLEVNKLTQRNASITTQLQQTLSLFDSLPRADIRMAYDSALDAQQRLFVMRGQSEKLHSDQKRLKQFTAVLEQVLQALEANRPAVSKAPRMGKLSESVEMVIQAQEAERQRLSRQMHDGPAQALSNFILQTEIAMRLFEIDQTKAKEELASLKLTATSTFQKVRDFIFELRPMMLDDLGLIPTLKRYVDALKDQPGLELRLRVIGEERRLESYLEVMIFRAVQEILNNSIQHSQAGQIHVQIDTGNKNIRVVVEDNGTGFNLDALEEQNNMGLKLIRERAEMLGGALEIDNLDGQGTRVIFQVPADGPGG